MGLIERRRQTCHLSQHARCKWATVVVEVDYSESREELEKGIVWGQWSQGEVKKVSSLVLNGDPCIGGITRSNPSIVKRDTDILEID
jgi:hypothetical protein